MSQVKIDEEWLSYRLGEGKNEGYWEVQMNKEWKRLADMTDQRTGFETR